MTAKFGLTKLLSAYELQDGRRCNLEPTTVADCDAIIKKGVRTKDGKDAGIVVGVSDQSIFIQKEVTKEAIFCQSRMLKALMGMKYIPKCAKRRTEKA